MQFNNIDIFIVITLIISALIALNRGFVKEMLSITGWIIAIAAIVFLLPIINPIMQDYIENETMAAVVSAFIILIIFFIIWIYFTANIVGKVRKSKLSNMDRFLGLIFGVLRAVLLVILVNILVSWIIPTQDQPDALWDSKLYNLAGKYAEPIEKLIPQQTKDVIHQTSSTIMVIEGDDPEITSDMDDLFDKLSKPQVERTGKIKANTPEEAIGYDKTEQKSLDRLIEMTIDE